MFSSLFDHKKRMAAAIAASFVEDPSSEDLEKGGKRAQVGEIREFGGRKFIRTPTTWKYYGEGTGAKAKEHASAHEGGKKEAVEGRNEDRSPKLTPALSKLLDNEFENYRPEHLTSIKGKEQIKDAIKSHLIKERIDSSESERARIAAKYIEQKMGSIKFNKPAKPTDVASKENQITKAEKEGPAYKQLSSEVDSRITSLQERIEKAFFDGKTKEGENLTKILGLYEDFREKRMPQIANAFDEEQMSIEKSHLYKTGMNDNFYDSRDYLVLDLSVKPKSKKGYFFKIPLHFRSDYKRKTEDVRRKSMEIENKFEKKIQSKVSVNHFSMSYDEKDTDLTKKNLLFTIYLK